MFEVDVIEGIVVRRGEGRPVDDDERDGRSLRVTDG